MPDPAGTAPAMQGPKPIEIVIVKPPTGARMEVTPGRFRISKKNDEQVAWHCASAAETGFTVEFDPNDNPFEKGPRFASPDAGPILSGRIKDAVLSDTTHFYKYKVTVGGNVLDPDGEVDQ
jgi:hypothetical protein